MLSVSLAWIAVAGAGHGVDVQKYWRSGVPLHRLLLTIWPVSFLMQPVILRVLVDDAEPHLATGQLDGFQADVMKLY